MDERRPDDETLLAHCKEPRHRELFAAVVEATRARSRSRRAHGERAVALQTLYERSARELEALPED